MRTGQVTTIARFGIEQPVALVLGDAQMIGDDGELIAGHVEHGTGEEALVHNRFSLPHGAARTA